MIIIKLPFIVKLHPLHVVMTIASYRFQAVVALLMAQFVVSKFVDSQKKNPKFNFSF
jgi:hypothetical protein